MVLINGETNWLIEKASQVEDLVVVVKFFVLFTIRDRLCNICASTSEISLFSTKKKKYY